jgi:Tol biopolymer transport system component
MGSPRRLTNDEANDLPFAWTPDSKAVLFASDRSGTFGIFKQGISEDTAQALITGPQHMSARMTLGSSIWKYQRMPALLSRAVA